MPYKTASLSLLNLVEVQRWGSTANIGLNIFLGLLTQLAAMEIQRRSRTSDKQDESDYALLER